MFVCECEKCDRMHCIEGQRIVHLPRIPGGKCRKAEGACGGAPESVPLSRMQTGQCGCSCSRIKHATQGQSKQAPPGTAASSDAVPRFDPVCDRERCGRARLKPHTNPNRTQKKETAEFSLRHREPVNRASSRTQQASARTHDANFLEGGPPARIPERLNPRQTAMPYGAPPGV